MIRGSILSGIILMVLSCGIPRELPGEGVKSESDGAPADSLVETSPADSTVIMSEVDSMATEEVRSDSLLDRFKGMEGSINYWGKVIQSRIVEKSILISGEAGVAYGTTTLEADSIQYNYETGSMWARGSPVLTDAGGMVEGKSMRYRINERKGIIKEGSTAQDQWFFHGEVVSKVGDKDIYGKNSRFTTCDLEDPHYHFASLKMKVTIDEKVVARPVIFYVRDIPILFIPFYIFPIQKGRKSGFLRPKFGLFNDGQRGRSIRDLGYFFALSDYYDLTVSSDLYESARWSIRGEGRYARRYRYRGDIFYSFTDDALTNSRKSLLSFRHNHTLNRETTLRVEGNFASDRTIFSDISFDIDEVLQRSLESRATYNRRTSWGSYYITGYNDFSLDRNRTRTQFPLFSLSKNSSPLISDEGDRWYHGINYNLNTRFESMRIREEDDITAYQTSRTNLTLTDPLKIKDFLNVTPRLNLGGAQYYTTKDGTGFVHQETYETSLSLFTRIYGIFNRPTIGPMTRWRHTISPQINYRYRPNFDSQRFSGLTGFPGAGGEANTVALSLTNDFDAKYLDGEEEKDLSLLSVIQSTSYSFVRARTAGQSGWGNLSTRFESSPSDRYTASVQITHSLYDGEMFDPFLTAATVAMSLRGAGEGEEADSTQPVEMGELTEIGDELSDVVSEEEYTKPREISQLPWMMTITHTLSRSRAGSGSFQSLYGTLSFNPTHKWRLTYTARYSFDEERVQNQRLTLRRDLHRWELLLSFVRLPGDRFSYEFRVNLVDFPALEFKRSVRDY